MMPTVEYLNYEVVEDNGWDMYDDPVFNEAADMDLDDEDYGELDVNEGEYILEAAEAQGYDWPFSCRAGACANCAAIVTEGEPMQVRRTFLSSTSSSERICCMSMSISPSRTMAAQFAQAPARHEKGQS